MPTKFRPARPAAPHAALRLAAALLAGAGACQKEVPAAPPERPPAPVRVEAAVARDVPVYLEEIGRCTAREFVVIQPQVSGPITAIQFQDGADVKKGDLLFTLDSRPFAAALDYARAQHQQSHTQLEWAEIEIARLESILKTNAAGAVSKQDFDAKKNALASAKAKIAATEAEIAKAELDVEYCAIRSPIDGRAGQRLADVGNVVKERESRLLEIQRLDPIYVDFTVAEQELPRVRAHLALGALRVEARAPGAESEPRVGELTFVDSSVRPSSGTVRLRATVANPARQLWPGQFVNVRLVLAEKKGAVLVPAAALQMSQTGPYVYVVSADGVAEARPVREGQRQRDAVVIDEGVAAGEAVVVDGQLAVTPGGRVRVVGATSEPARKP